MKTFFKIFFIAAFAGAGFLLYSGWKSLDQATLALGYDRAVLQLRKFGISVPNALDKTAGVCIPVAVKSGNDELVEVKNEPFSYGTPLKLEISEPLLIPLCRFVVPGVGFTVSPNPAAIISIYREQGKPGIVELKSGDISLSSEKLEVRLLLPNVNIQLKSAKKTSLQVALDHGEARIRVMKGAVKAQINQVANPKGQNVHVTFYSNVGARLSVNGSPDFSSELEAEWMPTGLNFKYKPNAMPAPASH